MSGKLFSTENHPVEAILTVLQLKNVGPGFVIATPNGKPIVLQVFHEKD